MHVEPRRWFGSRPTLPDYLPAIGKLPGFENIYYAFGHNHLGLTQAPITSECLAREISGEASDIDLSPFSITRFGRNR
jgi:D-amino-acid dehydrogenase